MNVPTISGLALTPKTVASLNVAIRIAALAMLDIRQHPDGTLAKTLATGLQLAGTAAGHDAATIEQVRARVEPMVTEAMGVANAMQTVLEQMLAVMAAEQEAAARRGSTQGMVS